MDSFEFALGLRIPPEILLSLRKPAPAPPLELRNYPAFTLHKMEIQLLWQKLVN